MGEGYPMKALQKLMITAVALLLPGCYVGSNFHVGASSLDQPVSFSDVVHNSELQVVGPGEYTELGQFSISFTGWSFGFPITPNPSRDISKELNAIVLNKGGNAITRLTIRVANNPVNTMSMVLRGISFAGFLVGGLVMLDSETNRLVAAEIMAVSLAGILFIPTIAEFTLEGTVVKLEGVNK